MGDYSVPQSIRAMKPKGTMVKAIHGRYYVYTYSCILENGKRKTKMGAMLGTIKPDVGFVPTGASLREDDISTLEFGQYAIAVANSAGVLERLKRFFREDEASLIYTIALIHFVNGFAYMKDLQDCYEISTLSLMFPGLKLGYRSLAKLYENLGRRQTRSTMFEQSLIDESSGQMAIDGHVIPSCSQDSGLARKGYKFQKLGEPQMNMLMAYDVNTGRPIISRIYEGGSLDKVNVNDLLDVAEFRNVLFIVDCGFFSEVNLEHFSRNGNSYIVPLPQNTNASKDAVADLHMSERFVYSKGKRTCVIEYKEVRVGDRRILVYRDLCESAEEQANYLRHVQKKDGAYSMEKFESRKDFMGVYVLQTNLNHTAESVFRLYKKCWSIETFFNYFKNGLGFETTYQQDYYKMQGLSFVMLVCSLIHHDMSKAMKKIEGVSVSDCLRQGRILKASKRHGVWVVCNCRKKIETLFENLNTPLKVVP